MGGLGEGDGSATRGRLRTAPRVAVFFLLIIGLYCRGLKFRLGGMGEVHAASNMTTNTRSTRLSFSGQSKLWMQTTSST